MDKCNCTAFLRICTPMCTEVSQAEQSRRTAGSKPTGHTVLTDYQGLVKRCLVKRTGGRPQNRRRISSSHQDHHGSPRLTILGVRLGLDCWSVCVGKRQNSWNYPALCEPTHEDRAFTAVLPSTKQEAVNPLACRPKTRTPVERANFDTARRRQKVAAGR